MSIILQSKELTQCPTCSVIIITGSEGCVTLCSDCGEIIQFKEQKAIVLDMSILHEESRRILTNIQRVVREKL